MAANLVTGGAYKGRKPLPPVIPCRTLPDIGHNAIIIGVCGVPAWDITFQEDSWFLSDFCAFNYLLKGLGSRQTWISAVSEDAILEFIKSHPELQPGLLHGNPYNDRKIVFSKELNNKKELTPFTVYQPGSLASAVHRELRDAAAFSKTTVPPRPIMLFIFGHGTESLGVYVNYDDREEQLCNLLSFDDVALSIGPDCPASVITTSYYSGGWAVRPNVNMTVFTAAGVKVEGGEIDEGRELSKSWPVSNSISRACGSIFASTLIRSFTSSTSPLLEVEEGRSKQADDDALVTLQPQTPDDAQTQTYNAFCKSIVDVLKEEITRWPEEHVFHFAAQDDEWAQCWMARTGMPLSHFERRWADLPLYGSTQPNSFTNLDPRNILEHSATCEGPGPSAYDRARTGSLPVRSMSFRTAHRALRLTAQKHIDSCPGDWHVSKNIIIRGAFSRFARGESEHPRMSEERVISTLLFREQLANYIDFIVDYYKLPRAQGKTLLFWDTRQSDYFTSQPNPRTKAIAKEIASCGLQWPGNQHQGVGFIRPAIYLAECMSLTSMTMPDIRVLIKNIKDSYEESEQISKTTVMRSRSMRHNAEKWFKSIGKRMRSVSPVKRDPKRTSLQNIVDMNA